MHSSMTIMVVDDIPLMRTMLVKYVQTLGKKVFEALGPSVQLRIVEAPNGKVALEKLQDEDVKIIFLDLMMPEMDGLTFLSRKQEQANLADIPVIVCSAVGEDEIVERAKKLGASAYIQKPFKMSSLEVEFRDTVSKLVR